jgi:hypothetical protein
MSYIDPLLPLALAFLIASLFFVWRSFKKRYWLLGLSVAGLVIISSSPVSALFAKPLDARYDGRPFVDKARLLWFWPEGATQPICTVPI